MLSSSHYKFEDEKQNSRILLYMLNYHKYCQLKSVKCLLLIQFILSYTMVLSTLSLTLFSEFDCDRSVSDPELIMNLIVSSVWSLNESVCNKTGNKKAWQPHAQFECKQHVTIA